MSKFLGVLIAIVMLTMAVSAQQANYGKTWIHGQSRCYETRFDSTALTTKIWDSTGLDSFVLIHQSNRSTVAGPVYYLRAASNVCDANGDPLVVSNACRVWDGKGNLLENGDSIAPNYFYDDAEASNWTLQNTIVLPVGDSIYYVFSTVMSDSFFLGLRPLAAGADLLNYAVVDMKANNYAGRVVSKKNILIQTRTISHSEMTAVRHGNGVDWWLVKRGTNSTHPDTTFFYVFLVKKDSILGPSVQKFKADDSYGTWIGQSCFNNKGDKYATCNADSSFILADFDRCTGTFSNVQQHDVAPVYSYSPTYNVYTTQATGVCFSPNDSFLYVGVVYGIAQYPVYDSNMLANRQTIAQFDTIPPHTRKYLGMYPAPNGKIYVTHETAFLTWWNVIEFPNKAGLASGFCGRCQRFPSFPFSIRLTGDTFYYSAPEHPPHLPNYALGASASGCSGQTAVTTGMLYGPYVTQITPGKRFCQGGSVNIQFSAAGFDSNNVFTAQLSNRFGSFANPTILGTVGGSYGTSINGSIPIGQQSGTGYRIRIVASSPARIGFDNGSDLTVNARPTAAQTTVSPSGSQSICPGSSLLFTAPADTTLTFQWLQTGTAILGATNPTYTATTAGTYVLEATNINGCSRNSGNRVVTLKAAPPATLSPGTPQNLCPGQSVTLQANAGTGLSYQWRLNGSAIAGATQSSYTATTGGSYGVGVSNGTGCTTLSAATVVTTGSCVNGPAITSLSPSPSLCPGGALTVNFTASGFDSSNVFTVELSNSAGSFASPVVLGTLSGANGGTVTATLSATQAIGSGYRIRVLGSSPSTTGADNGANLSVSALPTTAQANVSPGGPQSVCPGGSVTFTAVANPGFTYQWLLGGQAILGATNNTYAATAAGTYAVKVSNAGGCSRTSGNRVVSLATAPPATLSPGTPQNLCLGQSVTLQANAGTGLSYQWRLNGSAIAGATQSSYTATTGGSYGVGVSNSTGCTTLSAATVVSMSTLCVTGPSITKVSPATNLCQDGPVSVSFTASGFQANNVFTVQLSSSSGSFANPVVLGTLSGATGGTVTGTLSATQASGSGYRIRVLASAPATIGLDNGVNLTVSARPTTAQASIVQGSQSVCPGASATFSVPSTMGMSYQWQYGGANVSGATSNSLTTTQSGTYRVLLTNGSGCSRFSSSRNLTLQAAPGLVTITPSGTVSSPVLLTGNASGTGLSWQWFNNGQAIAGATNKTYQATTAGSYSVVSTKTSTGCSQSATVPVVALRLWGGEGKSPATRMLVYPNPSQAGTHVLIQSDEEGASYAVRILDASGRVLQTARLEAGIAQNLGATLSPGVYTIEAVRGQTRMVETWVKQ